MSLVFSVHCCQCIVIPSPILNPYTTHFQNSECFLPCQPILPAYPAYWSRSPRWYAVCFSVDPNMPSHACVDKVYFHLHQREMMFVVPQVHMYTSADMCAHVLILPGSPGNTVQVKQAASCTHSCNTNTIQFNTIQNPFGFHSRST
jgi:hypothetical protein